MKMTLSTNHAADLLRQDDNANWSYAGAYALIEYLEQIEEETGQDMELDRVAIRCDFSEYEDWQTWAVEYFGNGTKAAEELGLEDDAAEDEWEEKVREYINYNGTLIEFDGGIIVSSF